MMNRRKNLTVDGIHYYLVGNCYVPTAPGFVPDRRTDDYGMLHLKYLQMAHPDEAAELLISGRGRQYLLRIDQLVKQFIKEREEMAPIPQLSDPAFEEKYIRHHIVSCNATCKAETRFVLSGLHRDILADIKVPDCKAKMLAVFNAACCGISIRTAIPTRIPRSSTARCSASTSSRTGWTRGGRSSTARSRPSIAAVIRSLKASSSS